MQLHQNSIIASLAIFMVIVSFSTTAGQVSAKGPSCCTKVSTKEITDPILSFAFQNGKPPCVPAFVFETEKAVICSAPRLEWVRKTIKELRSLKLQAGRENRTTTTSPMTTQL
ncbi:hypothetical protein AALO_G00010980 [Alosa alosa]|uniref:Chemokine interleukin-8-like domain-containing protein n=1 Tax=Alosa alosa TaxID=278164 RepID=A0AAV6HFH6_9TELE|nr:hypothetical protein AALO_G00010980 [Alosa alosa]